MPFSTSSPLTTTLNRKFKKALHQVFLELLSTLLKWLIPNSVHSSFLFWTSKTPLVTQLDYHHIPDHIKSLVKSHYTDLKTSILTNEFRNPFISVGRGVLQGDCLSPLLFNLCFNTFLQHIKSEKYRQFGFSLKFLNPIHWFQLADDAAVISGQESENQHLINRFIIWCNWSNMIIRVDKCSTFNLEYGNCALNLSNIYPNC